MTDAIHQTIKNNDTERIYNVLKYMTNDGFDSLILSSKNVSDAAYMAQHLQYSDYWELSGDPEKAKKVEIVINKNDGRDTYLAGIYVYYKNGGADEEMSTRDMINMTIHGTMEFIRKWIKRFPSIKIDYYSYTATPLFGHKSAPKRKCGICQLENSVRRMF